jgi:hypothetical protein
MGVGFNLTFLVWDLIRGFLFYFEKVQFVSKFSQQQTGRVWFTS